MLLRCIPFRAELFQQTLSQRWYNEETHLSAFFIPVQHVGVQWRNTLSIQLGLLAALFLKRNKRNMISNKQGKSLPPLQRCPFSPVIHSEEVLISSWIQLITVTTTRRQGVLLAQGMAQRASFLPIKPSLLKVQRSVTSAEHNFGSQQSTSCSRECQSPQQHE